MDRITEALLAEFCERFKIQTLPEDEKFEHFAAYLTVWRHYSESAFDPGDLVTGSGGDTGIDAIAVVANNNIVTDPDSIDEILSFNGYLDVSFIFVQAERSSHFDGAKIGTFGFGVRDFFGAQKLPRNEELKTYDEIMKMIYKNSSRFRPARPSCYLYYVTTGKWVGDQTLVARANTEVDHLKSTNMFSTVEFLPVDADLIQKFQSQTVNAISRTFEFIQKTTIPAIGGVREAYLGFLPALDFLSLVCDDKQNIIKSLFYENVRDWEGYNQINSEIRDTLQKSKDRFVLMNNGVTIIAKVLQTTGNQFAMSDFNVVNGCQTSHVLHDNRQLLNESVRIPVRLISTRDDDVIESIIKATNRQTEVREEQFFAMKDFAKKLEAYFRSFSIEHRLYYERRAHQYDSQDIVKVRIVAHLNLVRAVGAMFLGQPHITTKSFRTLLAKVGKDMFVDTDRLEPYYVSALGLYRLEESFRAKKIDTKYKAARYQLLLAMRFAMDAVPLPKMNSREMGKRCDAMMATLNDEVITDTHISTAIGAIEKVAGAGWTRDTIRTEPVTKAIFEAFGQKYHG